MTRAAMTEAWIQAYDGPAHKSDYSTAIVVDRRGDVLVTGASGNSTNDLFHSAQYVDIYTAKYAARNGALLWERRYNGPSDEYDAPRNIALDRNGNAIVLGVSMSGRVSSIYVAKYDSAFGSVLWEQRIENKEPNSVTVDHRGDVILSGSNYEGPSMTGFLAKLSGASGDVIWIREMSNSLLLSLKSDPRGNLVAAGSFDNVFATAKFSGADGSMIWEQRLANGRAIAVALDRHGDVVTTGSTWDRGVSLSIVTAKYSGSNGQLIWERSHHDPRGYLDFAVAVAVDRTGDVVVSGNVESQMDESNDTDMYTAKYAAKDGAILWERIYDGPINGSDRVVAMALDARGDVTMAGDSGAIGSRGNNYLFDFYMARYDGNTGKVRWEQRYDSPDHGDDRLASLALGLGGEVAVTGSSSPVTSTPDIVTLVYRSKKHPLHSRGNPVKKENHDEKLSR